MPKFSLFPDVLRATMRVKIFATSIALTLFLSFLLFSPSPAHADNNDINVDCQITIAGQSLSPNTNNAPSISADEFVGTNFNLDGIYRYSVSVCGDISLYKPNVGAVAAIGLERNDWNFPLLGTIEPVSLTRDGSCLYGTLEAVIPYLSNATVDIENTDLSPICRREYARLAPQTSENASEWEPALAAVCSSFELDPPNPIQGEPTEVSFTLSGPLFSPTIRDPEGRIWLLNYRLTNLANNTSENVRIDLSSSLLNPVRTFRVENPQSTTYRSTLYLSREGEENIEFCNQQWQAGTPENPGGVVGGGSGEGTSYSLCSQIPEDSGRSICEECATADGIWTAFGCIKTNPQSIITSFMQIGLGLAGGVALIMILAAGFLYTTSQGDIKRTGEAKELLTSAIMGLLFIIFSVVILQFIGVSILQIPGFGGP